MGVSEDYLREHTVNELKPRSGRILLVAYDPQWVDQFQDEANRIRSALGRLALQVEHVGSTSVPDLPAKPVIDIVLVVADSANEAEYAVALERAGYKLHIREPDWHEHRMFNGSESAVNLHVFSVGCTEVARMLAFRDWLRKNQGDRQLYAQAKEKLAQQTWTYTQNYADAKTPVIEEIMSRVFGEEAIPGG